MEQNPTDSPSHLWDSPEAAAAWREGAAMRERVFDIATTLMLTLAHVRRGGHILDVAAGTGDQTLLAARQVGPTGSVLATDIAAEMLAVAAEAAKEAGLHNISTQVADAQCLDFPPDTFDAAISRFGIMFLPDVSGALARVLHALKPGGRCAAMVWGEPERNPAYSLPLAIARRHAGLPPEDRTQPGIFALGDESRLTDVFVEAGFGEVQVHRAGLMFRAVSARAFVEWRMGTGLFKAAGAAMDEAGRERAWAEIIEALSRFDGPDGFFAPGEALIGVGTKGP